MKIKKEWLLHDIAEMKKYIDFYGGDVDLMKHITINLLPLMENDSEIEIIRKPGANNDHLYAVHGKNISGKYLIKMVYIY